MPQDTCVTEAIARLDRMETALTDWECNFLESLLHRDTCTPKQRNVLRQMVNDCQLKQAACASGGVS